MILNVLLAPNPILSTRCVDVLDSEFCTPELTQFVSSMAETMYAKRGIGLAAPQVGDRRRIIVADPTNTGKDFLQMINPVIISHSEDVVTNSEGCLSIPGLQVSTPRFRDVTVGWRELNGDYQEWYFSGWDAVVIQHELDHLEGTTLLDKVSNFRRARYLKNR